MKLIYYIHILITQLLGLSSIKKLTLEAITKPTFLNSFLLENQILDNEEACKIHQQYEKEYYSNQSKKYIDINNETSPQNTLDNHHSIRMFTFFNGSKNIFTDIYSLCIKEELITFTNKLTLPYETLVSIRLIVKELSQLIEKITRISDQFNYNCTILLDHEGKKYTKKLGKTFSLYSPQEFKLDCLTLQQISDPHTPNDKMKQLITKYHEKVIKGILAYSNKLRELYWRIRLFDVLKPYIKTVKKPRLSISDNPLSSKILSEYFEIIIPTYISQSIKKNESYIDVDLKIKNKKHIALDKDNCHSFNHIYRSTNMLN